MVLVAVLAAALVGGCVPDTAGVPTLGPDCSSPPRLAPGASLFGCDLSGFDLRGLDLSGSDLSGADLSGADLSGSNLQYAHLEGANLTGANLTGADLTGAILAGAILIGALFVNAILFDVDFDFGRVFGASGTGGGVPVGGTTGGGVPAPCSGAYCPGYNETTVDTGDLICSGDMETMTGGQLYIHRTEADLVADGERSVVTDATTSFRGAVFDFSSQDESVMLLRGLSWAHADFSEATLSNLAMACQVADGARFSGATILGRPHAGFIHMSFRNSDFSGSTLDNVDLLDVTFAGSDAHGATWSDLSIQLVEELFVPASNANIPPNVLDLSDVDFSDAVLGLAPDEFDGFQGFGFGGYLRGDVDPPVLRWTDWAGADLRGALITDLIGVGNDFTGAVTDGLTVGGSGSVAGATFDAGWLGVDWTGDYDFTGAICPDGSTGAPGEPCF